MNHTNIRTTYIYMVSDQIYLYVYICIYVRTRTYIYTCALFTVRTVNRQVYIYALYGAHGKCEQVHKIIDKIRPPGEGAHI